MANGVRLIEIRPSGDLTAMARKLKTSRALVSKAITQHLTEYGRVLESAAQDEAPVATGKLRDSIRFSVTGKNSAAPTLVLTAGSKERPEVIVKSVLFGSLPHRIVPKREGGRLVFKGRDGKIHFAKSVNHPGTVADNFLQRAVARTEGARRSLAQRLGRLIIDRIGVGERTA